MAQHHKKIYPVKHFRDFIECGSREDGRMFDKYRPIAISVDVSSRAQGSSAVKIGNSSVVCGISAGLSKPRAQNPTHGFIIPRVDMSFISHNVKSKLKINNELPDTLSSMLSSILTDSKTIKLDDLCITPQKLVWVLKIDIRCLEMDGGLLDAAVLASIAALQNTKLPLVDHDVEINKYEIRKETRQLNVNAKPLISSFAMFEDHVLTDPTNEEEFISNAVLHISTLNGGLGFVHKRGGKPMSIESIQDCFLSSKNREKELLNLLENLNKE